MVFTHTAILGRRKSLKSSLYGFFVLLVAVTSSPLAFSSSSFLFHFLWLKLFEKCVNLKTIYVTSAFTTDKVTVDSWLFDGCVNLPNFNSAKTGKEMAHTGAGGYLTAATASWVRWDAPTGTLSFHRSGTKPVGDNIYELQYGNRQDWNDHAAEIKKVVFKAGFRDETGKVKRLKTTASLEQPIQLHAVLISCKVGYVKRTKTAATIEHVVHAVLSHIPRIEVRQIERIQT